MALIFKPAGKDEWEDLDDLGGNSKAAATANAAQNTTKVTKSPNLGAWKQVDTSRQTGLAGQTAFDDGYNISYNDDGYATVASNIKKTGQDRAMSKDALLDPSGRDLNKYGDALFTTNEEYDVLDAYGQMWTEAYKRGDEKGMRAAHELAELYRSGLGYSGGEDGSQYIVGGADRTGTKGYTGDDGGTGGSGGRGSGSGGSGGYGGSAFTSKYQDPIDQLLYDIFNRDGFSYDYTQDPIYQQYEKAYTRNGQRAMQDTIGQISARTGGLASSWAQSAGQQSYNNFMGELSDKIPELWEMAYSMYMDEGDEMRKDLDTLMGLDATQYDRFADDRDFNYRAWRDMVSDNQWQQSFDYDAWRDYVADQRYTDTHTDKGSAGDGGGGGDPIATEDYNGLFRAASQSENPQNFISSNYKKYGFSSSAGLWNQYQDEYIYNEADQQQYMDAIDPAILDRVNRAAEGGMDITDLANLIQSLVDEDEITSVQGDALAASFGF